METKSFYDRLNRPALIEILSLLFGLVQHMNSENEVLKIQVKRLKKGLPIV